MKAVEVSELSLSRKQESLETCPFSYPLPIFVCAGIWRGKRAGVFELIQKNEQHLPVYY